MREYGSFLKDLTKSGLAFTCKSCGHCCKYRDEPGYVFLTEKDASRLADFLGISALSFEEIYCTTCDGWLCLRATKESCIFFREETCRVYQARPNQCRSWPFCPENMSPEVWQREVVAICSGLGEGRLISESDISNAVLRASSLPARRS